MEARVTEKEEMFFLGVEEVFTTEAEHDADLVMFKRYMPQAEAFARYAVDDALYALGRTREDGSCTYMVGRRVDRMDAVPEGAPEGAVCRSIPASAYVEVPTTPRELGHVEVDRAKKWFAEHPEYRMVPGSMGIEHYPPECESADDPMWTWYAVEPGR